MQTLTTFTSNIKLLKAFRGKIYLNLILRAFPCMLFRHVPKNRGWKKSHTKIWKFLQAFIDYLFFMSTRLGNFAKALQIKFIVTTSSHRPFSSFIFPRNGISIWTLFSDKSQRPSSSNRLCRMWTRKSKRKRLRLKVRIFRCEPYQWFELISLSVCSLPLRRLFFLIIDCLCMQMNDSL